MRAVTQARSRLPERPNSPEVPFPVVGAYRQNSFVGPRCTFRWRASNRVGGFPRSREVRNHCVAGTLDPCRYPSSAHPCGWCALTWRRWGPDPQSFLKAALTFSPACLRLLTVWSLWPSRSICSSSVALPRFSLAAPLPSSFLFFNLSFQPIIGLLSRALSPGRVSRVGPKSYGWWAQWCLYGPHILAVNQICWVLWTEPAPSR